MRTYIPRALITSLICFTLQWDCADAAIFTVTSNSDNGTGTLREAIQSANGTPGSTINFAAGLGAIQITSPLPPITAVGTQVIGPITSQIIKGSTTNPTAAFFVLEGITGVVLQNLTIQDVTAVGGAGGGGGAAGGGGMGAGAGLLVASGAGVSVSNVSFTNNKAQGGAGGSNSSQSGGGGGGGFRASGGA
ncbi:MAG: hypothetical protein V4492_01065, partial [Chlamydiota bacterium]